MSLEKKLKDLGLKLGNAEINICRNKSEDEVVITLPDTVISATEYGKDIKFNDESFPCDHPYRTLLQIIKINI